MRWKPKLLNNAVEDLITYERQWKTYVIQQHFVQDVADINLKIPLPKKPAADELCWHYDKIGKYSVKSGYQVALKEKFINAIWKLILLEKIKVFMWRVAKNLLATADNLSKRTAVPTLICQRCKLGVETITVALIECKNARNIWLI